MQYLSESDKNKPLAILEDLVKQEPVGIHGSRGNDLVVMTREDYERISELTREAKIRAFKKSWYKLSEEARKNGLTEKKIAEILSNVS